MYTHDTLLRVQHFSDFHLSSCQLLVLGLFSVTEPLCALPVAFLLVSVLASQLQWRSSKYKAASSAFRCATSQKDNDDGTCSNDTLREKERSVKHFYSITRWRGRVSAVTAEWVQVGGRVSGTIVLATFC